LLPCRPKRALSTNSSRTSITERFDAESRKQQDTLAELKTSLLGQTSQALSERFDAESRKQQDAIAELKSSLGQTSQALSERFDVESRKQQETLSELKTSLFGQTSQALSERFDAESNKQQGTLAELKTSLLDQLSRTLDERLDTDERKQSETLQQLHANLVAEALKSFGEKLEAESVKQQQAIAELKASLAPQPMVAPEVPQAAFAEHEMHAHEVEETLPPVVAPQPQEHVLDLDAPMPAVEHAAEHDDHHAPETEQAPIAEPTFAAGIMSGAALAAEPLQPAMAFARDDGSAEAVANPATFLSAARQSLQAAAESTTVDGKTKDLFGLPFMRGGAAREKGKGETTSYALLAGVVLVAILAVAVTAGELISRSGAPADVHPARAAIPAAKPTPVPHIATKAVPVPATATTKPLPTQANTADAKRQLAVLANAGDAQAQMLLGLQQLSGPDKAQAVNLLGRAAASGEPVAQYRLGTLYAEGRGVPADRAKAFHWYSAAAQNGNRKAMSNLALAYAQGAGTTKNPVEAARWFSKASQLGLVDAQFDLAVLYERGLGVPQSLMDAYRWYLIAAKSGDKESKDRIEALASQLSPEDRSAAETAAAQFKPQPVNAHANEPQ
jgi:localization factor PodJL